MSIIIEKTDHTAPVSNSTIEQCLSDVTNQILDHSTPQDGLFTGNLGKALFLFYLAKYSGQKEFKEAGQTTLDGIFHNLKNKSSTLYQGTSTYAGLSGLAWVLDTLEKEAVGSADYTLTLQKLDRVIYETTLTQIKEHDLDFLHSSMGAMAYLMNRLPDDKEGKDKMERLATELWKNLCPYNSRSSYLNNQYIYKNFGTVSADNVNLGLAHGLCAILTIALLLYKQGIASALMREALEKGISFLLETYRPEHTTDLALSLFPSNLITSLPLTQEDNMNYYRRRLGWCYGDLNETLLLYQAGFILKRPDWVRIADKVGAFTLRKKRQTDTKIADGFLCHGSSGVSMFYQTLYQITQNRDYLTGSTFWMNKTVQFAQTSREGIKQPYSFLDGSVGIGLALLTFLKPEYNTWKKLLLLAPQ
uniref:Lanthionine synthetase C family protein n=1 Tax=Roseihalotalea indica TaxID=2867963 RepID=A0AA49GIR4_9BACT|nr:lanthionine synthetase C family protein [Tunicatimonas sp. TK19036]